MCVCGHEFIQFHFLQGKTATYNLTTFARVDVTDGFTITSMRSSTEASVRHIYVYIMILYASSSSYFP